jgi:hypothetical protein
MFINELKKIYNAQNVEHLVNVECFKLQHDIYKSFDEGKHQKLRAYAQNILRVSKRDARCSKLADLSFTATLLANRLEYGANEAVVGAFIAKGEEINGKSGRFTQMAKHRGKHHALIESVKRNIGGNKFQQLASKGALRYTAEMYVLNYAREAVNSELLSQIQEVVSCAKQTYAQTA